MNPNSTFPLDGAQPRARGTGKLSLDELEELFEQVNIPEDERTYGEANLIRFEDPAHRIISWLRHRPPQERITWINNFLQFSVERTPTNMPFIYKALRICRELSLERHLREDLRQRWEDILAEDHDPEAAIF